MTKLLLKKFKIISSLSTSLWSNIICLRVTWKPYLVSPSRTPIFNLGTPNPDLGLISFDQTIRRGDSKNTALAITANNAEYPYDSGLYLYPGIKNNLLRELCIMFLKRISIWVLFSKNLIMNSKFTLFI